MSHVVVPRQAYYSSSSMSTVVKIHLISCTISVLESNIKDNNRAPLHGQTRHFCLKQPKQWIKNWVGTEQKKQELINEIKQDWLNRKEKEDREEEQEIEQEDEEEEEEEQEDDSQKEER
ncbi:MAG: hypothetical protein EZS28_046690 [Streblomastix strix]|uniref:Uncharacterized protein n=1 Tax=Streblomastix strix TaxID=222440 RepID=A0A5J4TJ62_9EUKA|nr:MAG: hypothetical protein EZS28_046690 [Streblomastix strix]